MAKEVDPISRSFKNPGDKSNLSNRLPLPNIVRIEALNKVARDRYLGTIQKSFSNKFKDHVAEALSKKNLDKFYGFMKGSASKVLEIGSTWRTSGNTGGIVGFARNILTGGGSGNGSGTFDNIFGLVRDFTGISASSTGATTLKRFESTSLSGFTINCGWYLPEQYGLCIKSLKSILSMAYPVQINNLTARQILNAITETGNDAAKAAGEFIDAAAESLGIKNPGIGDLEKKEEQDSIDQKAVNEKKNVNANLTGPAGRDDRLAQDTKAVNNGVLDKNLTTVSDFFGRNLTFDPVPVRCSIGHYIDIEPLVITKLGIEFSDNTFINSDGRHLPIFCSVSITFDFWLVPAPKLQFLSLLGNEMFGDK
jgi:hypothetical protein